MQHTLSRSRTLRSRVVQGEPVRGLFVRTADCAVAQALALTGLDFIVLDVENSALHRAQVDSMIAFARANDLPVLVRLPASQLGDIQHAMMAGAAGVIASHLMTAAAAHTVVDFCRSAGVVRSYAGMGRDTRCRTVPWPEFKLAMAAEFLVMVQIDNAQGVAQAESIAAVAGLDAVFVGSLTLTLELELERGGANEKTVQAAIHRVSAACLAAGIQLGMPAGQDSADPFAYRASIIVAGNELNALRIGVDVLLGRSLPATG
ncbi:MAG: aldolase/citrate lyase family protein [Pseudomonadota bacterium]